LKKHVIHAVILAVFLSSLVGCTETTPPIPKVITENTQIPVKQSSYCWGRLGCADYAGGKTMLKETTPTVVPSKSRIEVSYDYNPSPNLLTIQQFQDEGAVDVPFQDGHFIAPTEKGAYYYGLSASWSTKDGKYSQGSTSSVFVIEVQ